MKNNIKVNDKNIKNKLNILYDCFKKNNISKYINYSPKKLLAVKYLDLSSCKLTYLPK